MYAKDGWFWVGISEYTVCLNNAHTIGLKSVKTNSETIETEPAPSDNGFATPGFITQLLGKKMVQSTQILLWHLRSVLLVWKFFLQRAAQLW